jgi:hypothetical protein
VPSLRLELEPSGTAVILTAPGEYAQELRQLASRFRTATHPNPGVVKLELDDLLDNLRELGRWPSPDVVWQSELRYVAEENYRDSVAAGAQLNGTATFGEPLAEADLRELLGPKWSGPLTPFQSRDISRLLSLNHGANFSVPGAGKTRVALATFQALRAQGQVQRLLVIGPKSAYESWQYENETCLVNPLRIQVLEGKLEPTAELVLVNYERLDGSQTALARWLALQPSMLILDEAHRMKLGADGVYGSACLALGPRARRRLILTGTPAPNGVKDLENLFSFVWPGQGRRTVTRAVAGGDLRHASSVLRPLFTRTTKKELALPPVRTRKRVLDLPPLHREIYAALTGAMSARAAGSADDLEELGRIMMYLLMAATSPALLAVGTTKHDPLFYKVPPLQVPRDAPLRQLLEDLPSYEMSPKYQETVQIVDANAKAGRKTLVWSTFIRSLKTLEYMLGPYQPAVIFGGTPDREDQLKRFREDPDCYALLSNPATLGEGISLHQVCHDAVFVDRDFAAARYMQSLDRIHRLGLPPDTVTSVTVLMAANTIDDLVERRLDTKLAFMEAILDDPAVGELADLEMETAVSPGMDASDLAALMAHLNAFPAR